jgi:hypothetical protein
MFKKSLLAAVVLGLLIMPEASLSSLPAAEAATPSVLPVRERAALVLRISEKRLDTLLPRMMRETGLDMWIIACNEDNFDPIFETMIPYGNWCPITQILVFYDHGPAAGVERLNVSRTDTQGLFKNAWDAAAWDAKKGESQWDALGRVVRERNPKRIGTNEGEIQWAAGGLTAVVGRDAPRGGGRPDAPGRGHLSLDHRRDVLQPGRDPRPHDDGRSPLVLLAARGRPRPEKFLLPVRLDPGPSSR